jgi:chromosome segregation ATPase
MAETIKNELSGRLQEITSAVKAVDEFSERLKILSDDLDSDRRIAREQLNEMSQALSQVQKVLAAVSSINPVLEGFRDEAQLAVTSLKSSTGEMDNTASLLKSTFDENLDLFKSGIDILRREIDGIQEYLRTQLLEVPDMVQSSIEPTVVHLQNAAKNLGDVSELVRGRLENLSSEINLQILNRISPEIESLNKTLLTARDAVSAVPDLVIKKIDDVYERGIQGIDKVLVSHDNQLSKMKDSTKQLEDVLNRSDDFIRMASSLERNVQLLVTLQQGLDERRPSITKRLDVALSGAAISFVVGIAVFDLDPLRVGTTLIPAILIAFNAEPIISKLFKSLRSK